MEKSSLLPAAALGRRIKEVRLSFGLSQQDIAYMASLDTSNFGKIERGKTNPNLDTITRIATALNTTVADLTIYITAEHVAEKDRRLTARQLLTEIEKRAQG